MPVKLEPESDKRETLMLISPDARPEMKIETSVKSKECHATKSLDNNDITNANQSKQLTRSVGCIAKLFIRCGRQNMPIAPQAFLHPGC